MTKDLFYTLFTENARIYFRFLFLQITETNVTICELLVHRFIFFAPSRVNHANEDQRLLAWVVDKLFGIGRNVYRITRLDGLGFIINVHFSHTTENEINFCRR